VACCVYLKIDQPELQKKAMSPCEHLIMIEPQKKNTVTYRSRVHNNCGIYENRPSVCQGYKCLWLLGHGEDIDRPDQSGILCDTLHSIEGAIECKSLFDGASETAYGLNTIKRMSASTGKVALIPSFYERKLKKVIGRPI
jgi:Fe-S-cluster containining protein